MMQVSALEGHRIWASVYEEAPNPLLHLEERILSELLGDLQGCRFVDVACGTGRWLKEARLRGASAIGIDVCPEMLARAGANVAVGDATRLPLPDECTNVVMCAFGLSYADAFGELARIARPGGSIFVSDMHPRALASGWTRSFRAGSEVYEIRPRRYSLPDLSAPRLRLDYLIEPQFGTQEIEMLLQAGKPADVEFPPIYIGHWIKM